jgi:hypothetical protein
MKSRIIQLEPEPEPTPTLEAEGTGPNGDRETWLRRAFFLVAVVGYFVLGIIHPAEIKVGDDTALYIGLHVVQPIFILLLAWGTWLLVKDLPGRAAQIARVAIVPYAIAYSMFDAIAGVALGQVVRHANGLSPSEGAVIQRAMDAGPDYLGFVIFIASGLSWFVMALAAALAVKPIGGRGPTLVMAIGAAIFAIAHPFPTGPVGIALLGLGLVWLELRREAAKAPEVQPVLAP